MIAPVDVSSVRLETERMILRPWRETDLEDFYEYASVDGVGQMAGWEPHRDREESKKILKLFMDHKKTFALELKENGKVIGSVGIEDWDDGLEESGRELGYVLSKDYWGRGLMPEAVAAVICWCFEELHYDFLLCGHYSTNQQSRRVIEKTGFQFLRAYDETNRIGDAVTTYMYIQWNPKR